MNWILQFFSEEVFLWEILSAAWRALFSSHPKNVILDKYFKSGITDK